LIAIPLIMNLTALKSNSTLFFLAIIFIAAATIDLVVNLIPSSRQEVLDMSNSLIEKDSTKRYYYDFKIEALSQLEHYQEAIDTFEFLEGKGMLDKRDYLTIGKLYNKTEDYGEALHFFEHSFKYYYTNPELINAMATSHIKLGDNRKAIKLLTSSLLVAPTYLDTYRNRAIAYDKIWEHDLAAKDLAFVEKARKGAGKNQ